MARTALRGAPRGHREVQLAAVLGGIALILLAALAAIPTASASSRPSTPTAAPGEGVPRTEVRLPPSAVTYPWSGGVADNGTNTTHVSLFLGNVTIPAGDPDLAGFNYTLGLVGWSSNCVMGQAALENGGGTWKFYWSFAPVAGSPNPPAQGWTGHLAPGDTYQLVLNLTGAFFEAQLYNVTLGHFWQGPSPPDYVEQFPDPALALWVGPSLCVGKPAALTVGMTVRASTLPGGGLDRDYFVQDEALVVGRGAGTTAAPNLWQPFFVGAPYDFAPQQGWSTTSLVTQTTDHPAVAATITTAPPTAVDAGQAIGVGVVGKPATLGGGANPNTYELSEIDFAGYVDTGPLSFANCSSLNGSTSNPGFPGNDPGIPAEYGYTKNTTPALSDIYLANDLDPVTNTSVDLRCYTERLTTPGYLDVWALAYLQYDVATGAPQFPLVDGLGSGPRAILGMNAYFWNVTVNPQPALTLSVAPSATVQVGESATFTAALTGGTAPFAYTWFVDGAPDGACTTATCSLSWGAVSTHTVWAAVVDGTGVRAVTAHQNETVVADLASTINPHPTAIGSDGSPVVFTGVASGGTGGYAYSFWVNGSAAPRQSGPSGLFSFVASHPAVYQVWVSINDSNQDVLASPHTNLTTAAGVLTGVSPLLGTMELGGPPVVFTASAVGGSGGYSYVWTLAPALVASGPCAATCSLSSATAGTYPIEVQATDSSGRAGAYAYANLTVAPPPSFLSWSGPTLVDAGSSNLFTATFQGGVGPFSYLWNLSEVPVLGCASTPACDVTTPHAGIAWLNVTITDSFGGVASSTAYQVQVVSALTVGIGGLSTDEVGLPTRLSALPSSGAGGNAYGFLSSLAPTVPLWTGAASSYLWTPATSGALQVWAEANDSTGFRAVSQHLNVTVLAALSITIAPAPVAATALAVALTATATVTGGESPYASVCWWSGSLSTPTCASSLSYSFVWSATGLDQVWASVTDALGATVASPHTNVTVSSGRNDTVLFVISPPDGGKLVLDGSVILSGGMVLTPGAHAVQAIPYKGYTFLGWVGEPAANLTIALPRALSTSIEVTGNGTVVAEFVGEFPLSLTLEVNGGSGSVDVNGTTESSGGSLTLPGGLYPLTGVPAAGYVFLGWTSDSTDIALWNNSLSTLVELGANGTLTMQLAAGGSSTVFAVQLSTSPGGVGGDFTIGSTSYSTGSLAPSRAGSYPLAFALSASTSGYAFDSWQATGGVSVQDASSSSTTITVTGNGTLTAVLSSTKASGPLGLSAEAFDVVVALLAVLLLLVLVGVFRHRWHHRNTSIVPGSSGGAYPPSGEDEGPFPGEGPPGT